MLTDRREIMTRINVIPVNELSDQHLIAEYHELPRVLKQDINTSDAPDKYCLGKGHMKWAKKHITYTIKRYMQLIGEMRWRYFEPTYDVVGFDTKDNTDYRPTAEDIELNRQRIREKYNMKPDWYRWTNRTKPSWL